MSRFGGFLLWCVVLIQWHTSVAWTTSALTPPSGFSLSMTAKINEGKQMYTCDGGKWIKSGSSAVLLDNSSSSKIGNFQSTYDSKTKRSTMLWTLFNSPGDQAESGSATSSVTGVPIYKQSSSNDAIPEVLFEVTHHQGAGAAALVAYVLLTKTRSGEAPQSELCTVDDISIGVPFYGVFDFYTQDTQPPANTPQSLKPNGRVVEGFFVKGKMIYRFDGKSWHFHSITATLYDVAGGNVIGKFGTLKKADRFGSTLHWVINNPNGFFLTGKLIAKPVKVSENGAPWLLIGITSSGGTTPAVGPFKFVQLTSTRGGLQPSISGGAQADLLWKSPFTGLFWFYTTS